MREYTLTTEVRTEIAWSRFLLMKKIACNRALKLALIMDFVQFYVFLDPLHGTESWTLFKKKHRSI